MSDGNYSGGLSGLIASLFGGGSSSLSNLASNTGATTAYPNVVNTDIANADAQSIANASAQPSLMASAGGDASTGQPPPAQPWDSSTPDTSASSNAAQQFSTILQQQGGTGQGQPPVAAATGPGPQPGQGPQPWGANGGPMPGSVRQPPPGYQAVPPGTPANIGGPPVPPSQQPQASPGAGGGGVGPTPQMSAPQGIGGQGNLGGAAGMPLPALVDQLLRQMQGGGQRYPIYRNPAMMRNVIGRERPGISGQRGNFSGQNNRPYGVTSRPGSGWPAPRYNYFQHAFAGQPPPSANQMQRLNTPAGQIMAHPMVAHDINGFTRDLQANGFPFERQWGSYNQRRMRWGPAWSSHAYGSAFDINDRDGPLSPRVANWIRTHPQLWNQLKWKWNMGQPLAGPDGISGKDPAHVEWMGPRQQGPQQQGPPPTPDGTQIAQPPAAAPAPQPAAATGPIPQAYPWGQGPGYTPDGSDSSPPPAQPWTGGDASGGNTTAMA